MGAGPGQPEGGLGAKRGGGIDGGEGRLGVSVATGSEQGAASEEALPILRRRSKRAQRELALSTARDSLKRRASTRAAARSSSAQGLFLRRALWEGASDPVEERRALECRLVGGPLVDQPVEGEGSLPRTAEGDQ